MTKLKDAVEPQGGVFFPLGEGFEAREKRVNDAPTRVLRAKKRAATSAQTGLKDYGDRDENPARIQGRS
jgi:hypothetical protein